MYASVCMPCFFSPDVPIRDAFTLLTDIGYKMCEFWRIGDNMVREIASAATDAGVSISGICTDDFRMNESSHTANWLETLKKTIDKAHALGAKNLITQVGQDTGEARQKQKDAILSALHGAAEILKSSDIRLLLEPLNTIYDHKGYYLDSANEAAEIARSMASKNIGIVLDFYHQQASGGDLINTFLTTKDVIFHVHAAANPGRHELWLGEVNYERIFSEMRNAGYTGNVGLEYIPTLPVRESLSECRRHCSLL